MKKALVIYNPVSGAKSWKNVEKILHGELEKQNFEYTWFETQSVERQPFGGLFKKKYDRVIVVGGDGTVAEVAHYLIQHKIETPMVIIPQGSANLLSRSLGIPQQAVRRALRMGLTKPGKPIDAMQINKKYYALIAVGKGYDVFLMKNTPRNLKRKWGVLAYAHTIFKTLFPFRRRPYKLSIDGERHHVMAKSILVFNTLPIIGLKWGERINPNDGKLNVAVFNPRLFRTDTLLTFVGKSISIQSKHEHEFDLDGEVFPGKSLTIEAVPKALNVVFTKTFK
jgi:YegS/Rv2252/BmrU family lipid kinase